MGFELLNGFNVLSIYDISRLEILDLPRAGLTGDFPSDLCHCLPRLQNHGLGYNKLSGEIPRNISACTQFQILFLFQNNFVGTIPRELEGVIPDEVGNLQQLLDLWLSSINFNGSIPFGIFSISKSYIYFTCREPHFR